MEIKVIADSVSPSGKRISSLQLRYWRSIHAEVLTHRVFTRNASSSRAIPVQRFIDQVLTDPAGPSYWGSNKPGMQAGDEIENVPEAVKVWKEAAQSAAESARRLHALGLHKQIVNRVLEPFQFISVLVTTTELDNFYALRDHPDAQPEIADLARAVRSELERSKPQKKFLDRADAMNWHLPYIRLEETMEHRDDPILLCRISAARCARVSYLKHDGEQPSLDDDLALFDKLAGAEPIHASPLEHQACPMKNSGSPSRNFRGWQQYRSIFEGGGID